MAEVPPPLEDQVAELKQYCDEVLSGEEGGTALYLLKGLRMPHGCTPERCDAVLAPTRHNNYSSRLYFAQRIEGPFSRNWNFSGMVLGRNWQTFSFEIAVQGLSLAEILRCHLAGLVQSQ